MRKCVFNQTYLRHVHERETPVTEGMCSSLIEFFEQDILEEKGMNARDYIATECYLGLKLSHYLIFPVGESIPSLFLPIKEEIDQFSIPLDYSYVCDPYLVLFIS